MSIKDDTIKRKTVIVVHSKNGLPIGKVTVKYVIEVAKEAEEEVDKELHSLIKNMVHRVQVVSVD